MGQHKYNPTAVAAKNGELPPKPKKMSKREQERELYAMCEAAIVGRMLGKSVGYRPKDTVMVHNIECKPPRKNQ
jgi:hypothetical protein